MPDNLLVTGPPRSGKTTVVQTVVERLEDAGYRVGGLYSPERRESGERVGFDIQDVMSGETGVLARVDRQEGPRVGKYRVALEDLDPIAGSALQDALADADVIVIDEIAPMEVVSEAFRDGVSRALDADRPVLAAIHSRSTSGFIGAVKDRNDVEVFEVRTENRDVLPDGLTDRLIERFESSPRSR